MNSSIHGPRQIVNVYLPGDTPITPNWTAARDDRFYPCIHGLCGHRDRGQQCYLSDTQIETLMGWDDEIIPS